MFAFPPGFPDDVALTQLCTLLIYDDLLKPQIKGIVKIDVCQQRRYHPTLSEVKRYPK
jgi:hypothetical protein